MIQAAISQTAASGFETWNRRKHSQSYGLTRNLKITCHSTEITMLASQNRENFGRHCRSLNHYSLRRLAVASPVLYTLSEPSMSAHTAPDCQLMRTVMRLTLTSGSAITQRSSRDYPCTTRLPKSFQCMSEYGNSRSPSRAFLPTRATRTQPRPTWTLK